MSDNDVYSWWVDSEGAERMPARANVKTARPRARLVNGRADWYKIRNYADGRRAEISVYDEVGFWGVTAEDFARDLKALDVDTIDLRINSPGGEIFDGITIHNLLRAHRATVTTYVDGLAASIASVIALAGDRVVMMPHSQMMIHEGAGLAIGNADDMREMAELLDRQSDNIAGVYAERAGGTPEEWRERMRAETWMTASEAVTLGLADEVAPMRPAPGEKPAKPSEGEPAAQAPANDWDLSIFRYAGRDQAPTPMPDPAVTNGPVPDAGAPAQPTEPAPQIVVAEPALAQPEPEATPAAPVAVDLLRADVAPPTVAAPAEPTPAPAPDTGSDAEEPTPAPAAPAPDPWTGLTAHLLIEQPTSDDQFTRLTEALL